MNPVSRGRANWSSDIARRTTGRVRKTIEQKVERLIANSCWPIPWPKAEEPTLAANAADFRSFARDAFQYSRAKDRRRAVSGFVCRLRRSRNRSALAWGGARHIRRSLAENVRADCSEPRRIQCRGS